MNKKPDIYVTDTPQKTYTMPQLERMIEKWETHHDIENIRMEYDLARQLLATMKMIQILLPYHPAPPRVPRPKFETFRECC